jgi:hypothetical protein
MYKITAKKPGLTILGKPIPQSPTELNDLTEFFGIERYNGGKQTHESLHEILKDSYKWQFVDFRTVVTIEKPEEKKVNISQLSNKKLANLAKEKGIKLDGKEDRKKLMELLKDKE